MGISTIPRIGFSTVRFSVSRLDWRNGSANPFWIDLTNVQKRALLTEHHRTACEVIPLSTASVPCSPRIA